MSSTRTGSLLILVTVLIVSGCSALNPSSLAQKNQVEPVMRTEGLRMTAAAYYQQGRIALTAGDLESAQRHFAQSLLHDPAYLDALNGMAAILTVQGRYQESLHLLQQAVARAPDDKMYQRNIVRVEQLILHAGTETPPPQTGSHAEVLAGGCVNRDWPQRAHLIWPHL